jgi:hypothetical protein
MSNISLSSWQNLAIRGSFLKKIASVAKMARDRHQGGIRQKKVHLPQHASISRCEKLQRCQPKAALRWLENVSAPLVAALALAVGPLSAQQRARPTGAHVVACSGIFGPP